MNSPVPLLPRRLVLAGVPALFGVAPAARADSDPPAYKVTTDSREYCTWLVGQVHDQRKLHHAAQQADEVRVLTAEGRKMCDEGHLLPGILRLRRALQILRGD